MRQIFAPAMLVMLASPVFLGAQQQEQKLLDRIHRPNMELTNPMQAKSFASGGGVKIQNAVVGNAAYAGAKAAPLKEFAGTRSFLGIKNPWVGSRVFETRGASLSPLGGLSKLAAAYPVRSAAMREFPASQKNAGLDGSGVAVRPFLVRGEAQGAIEQLSDKIKKEMTIDDIRELLNKPR